MPKRSPKMSPKCEKMSSTPLKPWKPAPRGPSWPILIVEAALLAVGEDLEGLRGLLELLLRLVVAGVAVRVVPPRPLAVRLLDLGVGRDAR